MSSKGKLAVFLFVVILVSALISLTLVQGEKPPDVGQPPSGILSEIYETLSNLETDLNNLQNGIDELWVEMNQHVDGFNVAITNLQNDVANVWVELGEMNNHYQGQIDELWVEMNQHVDGFNVAIINLQNDVEGLGDSLNSVHNQISLIWDEIHYNIQPHLDDIDNNIHPRLDNLQTQINNLNARVPQTGVISIPAASFGPEDNNSPFRNIGYLMHNQDTDTYHRMYAGLQLPHNAKLTRITFYWYDTSEQDFYLQLMKILPSGNVDIDVTLWSNGAGGQGYTSESLSQSNYIINNNLAYLLRVTFPARVVNEANYFLYAVIEYEYPA
jgi:hypothetical protein